jgi:hypothetical protein
MTELMDIKWRKSKHSGSGNTCVEVAGFEEARVTVRDSTDPAGPVLAFDRQEWRAFFQAIKSGAHSTR